MYGLIDKSIQCFIHDTYSEEDWAEIRSAAGLPFAGFEALLRYDDALTEAVLAAACARLGKDRETFLEDLGTYLVSHPNLKAVRRLLRFGGETFVEFLNSLDDLHDHARLAVPELELPFLELSERAPQVFLVTSRWRMAGFGHVLLGLLRAMADDYGALVVLDYCGAMKRGTEVVEKVSINLLEAEFCEGHSFALGAQEA